MMSDLAKRGDGAVLLEDEDFVTLTVPDGYFYHECCACGAAHKVHLRRCKSLTFRWERIKAIPAEDVSGDLVSRAETKADDGQ